MSSPFEDLLAGIVEPIVDTTFGDEERFDFRPAKMSDSVNGRPSADPGRPLATDVAAIFDSAPLDVDESGGKRDRPGFATTTPQVSVLVSAVPWEIRRGDEVKRKATGEVFRVTEIEPDGLTRVNLHLVLQEVEA
ncbi:head-tail joining protein [Microbaculum marinisediminis]|uniref:Head-to-tail stopper n=1 Tax=Microbaculum marinisediminis TaxID=2931392 RepID=A0AAW5QUF5_9HYPH|nr:hypothetical protein [Microbaculum sp. A6E488]MCT8970587.1 hypothetical protein [Microbaculum sp. A6E488]